MGWRARLLIHRQTPNCALDAITSQMQQLRLLLLPPSPSSHIISSLNKKMLYEALQANYFKITTRSTKSIAYSDYNHI